MNPRNYCFLFAGLLFVAWSVKSQFFCNVHAEELLPPLSIPADTAGVSDTTLCANPESFVGPEACATCHQDEYLIWARTNHATNAYDLLRTSSNAKLYAQKLGIDPNRVESSERCLTCHSTPQSKAEMRTGVVHGVTCESCHNAAGGEDGWLNCHSTYGYHVLRRENESAEHHQKRIMECQSKGQFRSSDLYAAAKRCYACHLVGDEELVVQGGHHPGNLGFEMTQWFDKGIRHNVFLNPHRNGLAPSLEMDPLWHADHQRGKEIDHRRLMYVVALLVDLEVSMSHRANAEHTSFARAAATRIAAAHSRLATIAEAESSGLLLPVVTAISQIEPLLFLPPRKKDAHSFLETADLITETAKRVSSLGNGSDFSTADQFLKPATN